MQDCLRRRHHFVDAACTRHTGETFCLLLFRQQICNHFSSLVEFLQVFLPYMRIGFAKSLLLLHTNSPT